MYSQFLKRVIDVSASFVALVLISPVFLIILFIQVILYRDNPFFCQVRPGLREKPFTLIKFRSMSGAKDINGQLLPDIDRMTGFGRFIRKTSLDEIPQLINVLSGSMSLVGPRPLLFKYIPLYSDVQKKRHSVRPGLTGWAQVNGRNSISWAKKLALDVYYVENISLKLDLKICWLTFKKVVAREGVNQSSARPMEPFNGYN